MFELAIQWSRAAAVNKITYGGGNLIRIRLGNHAGSRKQRKESKNAKKAITLTQTGVVMGEDCKLPDIKAGRCELTEAFVLDRKWSPPKAHRRSIKSTFGPQASLHGLTVYDLLAPFPL